MTEAGFFEPRKFSPMGIGVVVAFHAGLITIAALSRVDAVRHIIQPTKVTLIPIEPDPPKNIDQAKPNETPIKTQTVVTKPDPLVDLPPIDTSTFANVDPPRFPPIGTDFGTGVEPAKPPPDPVRIDAQFDPRYGTELKPPYPISEQRGGIEGTVTLRVLIGADGRVKAVEKVAATTDGFFRAAERQALSRWRFKPATLDGRPIESRKVMTLRFELNGDA